MVSAIVATVGRSFSSRRITVNGVDVHFCSVGEGDPLLLLHGGSVDSATLSWRDCLPLLGRHHRVIAPDLPGWGRTAIPHLPTTVATLVRFVETFRRSLLLERFSLCGFSLGGQVACSYALEHPRRVSRLILVSPAGFGLSLRWRILVRLVLRVPALERRLRERVLGNRRLIRLGLHLMMERIPDSHELIEEILSSRPGAAWASYLRHEILWSGFRTRLDVRAGELEVPTLIVQGNHDRIIPAAASLRAARLISDCRLCMLDGRGHWLPREAPRELVQEMEFFLAGGCHSDPTEGTQC